MSGEADTFARRFDPPFLTVSTAETIQIAQPIHCTYSPLPDITAYELAQLIPFLLPGHRGLYEADWQALGPAVTRHLRRIS